MKSATNCFSFALFAFLAGASARAEGLLLVGGRVHNWRREQRVTRAEALKMLTLWPACAVFQEKARGTIEAGKAADFTVLSADIMAWEEKRG